MSAPHPAVLDAPNARELLQRARDLGPALRDRLAASEAAGRLAAETVADLRQAGLFRILQPRRHGGYALHPNAFFDVQIELARHCPSTGWVYGVVGVHQWQLALFAPEVQDAVWGDDDGTLVASSYMPVGKVTRVDGGYRLSGRWSFSSGSEHCGWFFLGAFVPPAADGQRPDLRTFLLSREQVRIEPCWDTAGLKATGSQDVIVDDAFVPEGFTHRFAHGFRCESPGNAVNPDPLFRIPFGQLFNRSVAVSAIGILQGAVDAFRQMATSRIAQSSGGKMAEFPQAQRALADGATVVRQETLALHDAMNRLVADAEAGIVTDVTTRVGFRYESALGVDRCVQAVDALFTHSGGRALFHGHEVLRYFLDAHAARAHYANNPDGPGRNFGRVLLGGETQDWFL